MAANVDSVPKGHHTITPCLVVEDVARAIDFYTNAFGAKEMYRSDGPDGKLMHAEIEIGDSKVMLGPACPERHAVPPSELEAISCSFFLYVPDADAAFEQARSAGARETMPVEDAFWGDRVGQVADPFGHRWFLATHKEDLTDAEIRDRAEKAFSSRAKAH